MLANPSMASNHSNVHIWLLCSLGTRLWVWESGTETSYIIIVLLPTLLPAHTHTHTASMVFNDEGGRYAEGGTWRRIMYGAFSGPT